VRGDVTIPAEKDGQQDRDRRERIDLVVSLKLTFGANTFEARTPIVPNLKHWQLRKKKESKDFERKQVNYTMTDLWYDLAAGYLKFADTPAASDTVASTGN
jgi:hypothetical protein